MHSWTRHFKINGSLRFFKHLHQRRKVGALMEKCLNHFRNMKFGMIRWGWDKAWNDEDQVPISDACFDLQVCSTIINVTKCGGVFCLSCRRLFVRYTAVDTIKNMGRCAHWCCGQKGNACSEIDNINNSKRNLHALGHQAHCHDRCQSWLEVHAFAVFLVASMRHILGCVGVCMCMCVSKFHICWSLPAFSACATHSCCCARFGNAWVIRSEKWGPKRCPKMRHPRGTQRTAPMIVKRFASGRRKLIECLASSDFWHVDC